MTLRYVCIEVREHLRCGNVFLQFEGSLKQRALSDVRIVQQHLRFKQQGQSCKETCIPLVNYLQIREAAAFSNLLIEDNNLCIRLAIEEKPAPQQQKQHVAKKMFMEQLPQLQEAEQAALLCNNCACNLTEIQQFKRIREYPSGSIDMSEFFCHHGPDYAQVLVPSVSDLFYGFQFIVLNMQLLQQSTKIKQGHLYCARCLLYLGETMFEHKSAKLWSDALQLQVKVAQQTETRHIFELPKEMSFHLLHKITSETALGTEPLLPTMQQHCKVLLEATFPNRQRKFLLLHMLERELKILRNSQPLSDDDQDEEQQQHNNMQLIELERWKAYKLLYRFVSKETLADDDASSVPPLLAFWQQDISIHSFKVSPTLFSAFLQELNENSLLLPQRYRSTSEGFQLSYVFYGKAE